MTKKLIFIVFAFVNFLNLNAQGITFEVATNSNELTLLHSIRGVERFNSQEPMPTAILLIESGYLTTQKIAGLEGMDVVLHKLFISVRQLSNDGRTSEQSYWVDGNFYNPRNYKFDNRTQKLAFQHGTNELAKSTTLRLTPTAIEIE